MRNLYTSPALASDAFAEIATQADNAGELKSDRVAMAFERQILSGRLATGVRLPNEDQLCELLGVSRSVIRDSIRTLVTRGLVVVRQGSGTVVAEPGNRAFSNALLILLTRSGLTMGEVMQARATIEKSLVPLGAAAGTDEDWATLKSALDAFQQAVDAGDDQAAGSAHTRFHTGLLDAAHQPALSVMLNPMTELTTVVSAASILHLGRDDWEVREHPPILQALKARDSKAAVRAIAAHYAPYEVSTRSTRYKEFLSRRFSNAYFVAADGEARRRASRGRSRTRTRSHNAR